MTKTEAYEEEAKALFPEARVAVFSSDTVFDAREARRLIETMAAGEIDVLVATQAAAKGHNFPRLTLVGVLGADSALFAADFRAPTPTAAAEIAVPVREELPAFESGEHYTVTGRSLLLFALRAPIMAPTGIFAPISREGALVLAQGLVGTVQFFTGVPAALVALHVAGAAAATAASRRRAGRTWRRSICHPAVIATALYSEPGVR